MSDIDKTSFGVYVIASLWVDVARLGLTRIGGSIFVPSLGDGR